MSGSPTETLFKGIEKILLSNCNNNVFTASSVAFFSKEYENGKDNIISCGTTGNDNKIKIDDFSLFDLASLTKPLVTLLSVLTLIDSNKLSWFDTVDNLLPSSTSKLYKEVTLYHLLCHSSGLPAHKEYWSTLKTIDSKKRKKWLINTILNEKEIYKQGSKHIYSDLGYILLGFIIEEITGQGMDYFWLKEVAEPLGLEQHVLFPNQLSGKRTFVATLSLGNEKLQGVVHDDNCRAMGGVCGHAGLFGTAYGVVTICQELVNLIKEEKSRLPFSSQTLKRACSRAGKSEWTAGFNLPSKQNSSSGNLFSEESIGHLGYTGTSFWIDPLKQLAVVFLTNRVIKGENQKGIKALRPSLHNYVLKEMGVEDQA